MDIQKELLAAARGMMRVRLTWIPVGAQANPEVPEVRGEESIRYLPPRLVCRRRRSSYVKIMR